MRDQEIREAILAGKCPPNISFGGSLYLSGTAITILPEGLSVGGSLDLRGMAIATLPEGLSVGGSLFLSGMAITTLPEGLSVGGSLDLSGTAITTLPEGLSVGGYRLDSPKVPFVQDLDAKILEALASGGHLNMSEWHTCKTTHCRAGWAIVLAGEAGSKLEAKTNSGIAGLLIYAKSTGRIPNFTASDDAALADIKKYAGVPSE